MIKQIVVLVFILASGVMAQNYYVSPTGDSANDGLSAVNAWNGVQMGLDTIRAGDTLFIRPGYWADSETLYEGDTTGQSPDSVFQYFELKGTETNQSLDDGYAPRLDGNVADGHLTIKNYPGEPMPRLISDTTGTDGRFAFIGDQDSIIFDSLNFWRGRDGIKCENQADAITVKNCVLTLINKPSNSNWAGAINLHEQDNIPFGGAEMLIYNNVIDSVMEDGSFSGETGGILSSACRDLIIRKNTISNVYYGATMLGAASANDTSFGGIFDSNIVFNAQYAGLYAFKQLVNRDMDISFNLMYNVGRDFNISTISINFDASANNTDIRIYNNTLNPTWPIADSVLFSGTYWHSAGGIGIRYIQDCDSMQIFNNLVMDYGERHNHGYNDNAIAVLKQFVADGIDSFYCDYNYCIDTLSEDSTLWAYDTMTATGGGWNMVLADWITEWSGYTYANGANSTLEGGNGWSDPFTDWANSDYTLATSSVGPATGGRGNPWASYNGYDAPPAAVSVSGVRRKKLAGGNQ